LQLTSQPSRPSRICRRRYPKLPTFLREYNTLARQCATEGQDHVQFLARLVELELIDRERRMIEHRIMADCGPDMGGDDTEDRGRHGAGLSHPRMISMIKNGRSKHARLMGARPLSLSWRILVPATMPDFASGQRLAAAMSRLGRCFSCQAKLGKR